MWPNDRLEDLLEELVSTLADLSTAVSNLTAAVTAVQNAPSHLDVADQASLDASVVALDTAVKDLNNIVNPPVVVPPAPVAPPAPTVPNTNPPTVNP